MSDSELPLDYEIPSFQSAQQETPASSSLQSQNQPAQYQKMSAQGRLEPHIYQVLEQPPVQDSGVYASVSSNNSAKVHGLRSATKPPSPHDYRFADNGTTKADTNAGNHPGSAGKHGPLKVLLVCCGVLLVLVVMGIAIVALVLALLPASGSSSGDCNCREDINLLLTMVDNQRRMISALKEIADQNKQDIASNTQELTYVTEEAFTINSTVNKRIGSLTKTVASLNTRITNIPFFLLGDCRTLIEQSCFLARTTVSQQLECRTSPVQVDSNVIDFSCSAEGGDLVSAVASDDFTCLCEDPEGSIQGDQDPAKCNLSVTRCSTSSFLG